MKNVIGIAALILGVVFIALTCGVQADTGTCTANDKVGQTWLATGIVVKSEGSTFYLLGKDNIVYRIDGGKSEVFVDEAKASTDAWCVGDTARVYGVVQEPCKICAERVRVFKRDDASGAVTGAPVAPIAGSEKEVKIIIEKEQAQPAGTGAGETQPNSCNWRGWVADINYGSRRISLQTTSGAYNIDIKSALILKGNAKTGLGILNQGDAVQVSGTVVGLNEVKAQSIEILRSRTDAQGALPQTPISVIGVIQQIDYPSMTFKMQTETTTIVVMADKNTCIQHYHDQASFCDLKAGTRVRITGSGSPATGYAAQQILITGVVQ